MKANEPANKFTILDWIGVVYVVTHILILLAIPKVAGEFREMFFDLGGELPTITTVVLQPWFPIVLLIICIFTFILQWHRSIKININRRRAVIVLSFILSGLSLGLCVTGLYYPIFRMAGSAL